MWRFKKMYFIVGLLTVIVIAVKKNEYLASLIAQVPYLNKI
jgi:hypothetical protein